VAKWLNKSESRKTRRLWALGEVDDRITELEQAIREANAYERIANLVHAFQDAEREISDIARAGTYTYVTKNGQQVTLGFLQGVWINRINLILEYYNVTPHCLAGPSRLRRWWVEWIPAGWEVVGQTRGSACTPVDPGEMKVLQQVCTMATEGTLGYLAVCDHCGRWYVRRKFDQKFCTLKCRTHSEPFKASRRKFMKKYYKDNLETWRKRYNARKEKAHGKKR
jgi:hypothetical protein